MRLLFVGIAFGREGLFVTPDIKDVVTMRAAGVTRERNYSLHNIPKRMGVNIWKIRPAMINCVPFFEFERCRTALAVKIEPTP